MYTHNEYAISFTIENVKKNLRKTTNLKIQFPYNIYIYIHTKKWTLRI